MRTALLHHPDSALHRMPADHPECPERVAAVLARLADSGLVRELVQVDDAAPVTIADIERAHPAPYAARLASMAPAEGLTVIDGDTYMGPLTVTAAARAAGIATRALDDIMAGHYARAFCAVRPPGHHAETTRPMGFCFYNSIAIAARRAVDVHGIERVAILDFDVHHGNGSAEIFRDDPRVLVASSFEHPQYPNRMLDLPGEHLVFTPLPAHTDGPTFRRAIERDWLPALERHRPQLVLVSAGFDAHVSDPLASLELQVDDFRWITELICSAADSHADGRVLSMLEGGYDLTALAASAEAHVQALLER